MPTSLVTRHRIVLVWHAIFQMTIMAFTLSAFSALAALPTNQEVERLLKANVIDKDIAKGVAVALIGAEGIRIVTVGQARQGEVLKESHLFEIGSITKTFTATLLALASEKGEVKLEDSVEQFLPAGLKLRDSEGQPIRLVDLATHRSGLPRLADNMLPGDAKNPYADYTEGNLLDFLRHFKPTRARNAQYEYSNVGYGLLGYVLVRVAKAPSFDALLKERIFTPLGMQQTTADAARQSDKTVQPHTSDGNPTPAWSFPIAHAGAGAIRASIADMGRYVQAIAGLRDSSLAKAFAVATPAREQGGGKLNPVGLAFVHYPLNERAFVGHEGSTFGSFASMFVDLKSREGVVVLANAGTPLTEIALHLMDKRVPLSDRTFPKVVDVAESVLKQYVGVYQLTEQMQITIRANGKNLTAQATQQAAFEIYPESDVRFFAKVAKIQFTFSDLKDGQAGSVLFEQGGFRRVAKRVANAP